MTERRVIEVLQEQIDQYGQEYDDDGIEALKIAIKKIKQQERRYTMVKLVIHRDKGFIIWMESNGFTKRFFVTNEIGSNVFVDGQDEEVFFYDILDAVQAYYDCIISEEEGGE